MADKLVHRIFIGVTPVPAEVDPPNPESDYWLFEDGAVEKIENNDYIIQEN